MNNHTYYACWVHLVWCTADRHPCFDESQSRAVSKYLSNYAKSKRIAMRINFVNPDHVHAQIEMGASMSIDNVVKLLKGSSAHWINASKLTKTRFAWARGYAALTVSRGGVKGVTRYIAMQKTHHSQVSIEKELTVLAPGWSLREAVDVDPMRQQSGQLCATPLEE